MRARAGRSGVVGALALALVTVLVACAGPSDTDDDAAPPMPEAITSIDALGAAYLAAGGECTELVADPVQPGQPDTARCGQETLLVYSDDAEVIDSVGTQMGMLGKSRLRGAHWLIVDPLVEDLAESLDGDLTLFVDGPGPANMASDGLRVDPGGAVSATPALEPDETPAASTPASGTHEIVIYLDFLCPYCQQFEAANAEYIASLVQAGTASYEIHPVAILDAYASGTYYSTRATHAAACVADRAPETFMAFTNALFANQPVENAPTMPDDEALIALASGVGADIGDCQREQQFLSWVIDSRSRLSETPLADGSDFRGTPTVFVGGVMYAGNPDDHAAFVAFVESQPLAP